MEPEEITQRLFEILTSDDPKLNHPKNPREKTELLQFALMYMTADAMSSSNRTHIAICDELGYDTLNNMVAKYVELQTMLHFHFKEYEKFVPSLIQKAMQ